MGIKMLKGRTNFLFILPVLILFGIFTFGPALWGFNISLHDYKLVGESPFIGFQNYGRVIGDPLFWNAFKNTIIFALVVIPGQIILGLFFAFLMTEKIKGRGIFRTIYFIPVLTSWAIVSLVWMWMFAGTRSGLVNSVLWTTGLIAAPIPWLGSTSTAMPTLMLLWIWKGLGWSMLIFLAAMQTIPESIYESAKIDAAGWWRRFRYITLPSIAPTVAIVTALVTGGALIGSFTPFYIMTKGGPLGSTETIATYMYKHGVQFMDLGYGAAIVYFVLPICLLIAFIQIRSLSRRVKF